MADNKKTLGYEGLGDITSLMHNQGVSDLSWLSVNEEDYRAHEALPKQNLDIIPEFQKALSMEGDERVPSLIPLRPHTIVNTNPLDKSYGNPASAYNLVPARVAQYVMAGLPNKVIATRLQSEFSDADLRAASKEASEIISEKGLLGTVYVNADHLPRCAQPGSTDRKFATTVAKRALFVLAAPKCTGCVCNNAGVCSGLKKRIVSEVPYGPKLASALNTRLASEKREIDTADANPKEWKERIRSSFLLSPIASRETSVRTIQHHPKQVAALPVSVDDIKSFVARRNTASGVDKMPSPQYLKLARKMMTSGIDDLTSIASSADPEIRSLVQEHGLLGHSYLDMDAFGGCKPTLEHVVAQGCTPDHILRRSAICQHCKGASDGACAQLCHTSSIVTQKPVFGPGHFGTSLRRAVTQKRVSLEQAKVTLDRVVAFKYSSDSPQWSRVIAATNLVAPVRKPQEEAQEYSGHYASAHYGDPGRSLTAEPMDSDEVRRNISHLMNTGLKGRHLQAAVLQRYSREDLSQVPEVGTTLAADEGIQGNYFIDPTAYSDYGKGCNAGSKHFRKRGAANVLAASSCTGCVLQTAPGWCSKYSKDLIRSVPQDVRTASKRQLLVIQPGPVENPVEKYELASEIVIEPTASKVRPVEISLSTHSVTE